MGVRGEEERGGGKGLQTDMKQLLGVTDIFIITNWIMVMTLGI